MTYLTHKELLEYLENGIECLSENRKMLYDDYKEIIKLFSNNRIYIIILNPIEIKTKWNERKRKRELDNFYAMNIDNFIDFKDSYPNIKGINISKLFN